MDEGVVGFGVNASCGVINVRGGLGTMAAQERCSLLGKECLWIVVTMSTPNPREMVTEPRRESHVLGKS
jgi:hypothetical protein